MRRFIATFLLSTLFALTLHAADTPLRWGADAEGGAPFAFADPENPGRVIGYEVDIVQALAVATHVYCLQEGRVTLSGKPAELTREAIQEAYFGH